jgi:hypothetical protein
MKNTGNKPRLTPKLRFPEFRDWPGWEPTFLKELGLGPLPLAKSGKA